MLAVTLLVPLQWLLTSSTSKCWYPWGLSPQISSLLYLHSLSSDLIQTNGFKYLLDTDKPQIYVSSQDSPLTSRLMFSTCLFSLCILMFNRYLKLGICNTEVLFPQNLLCQIFFLSEMAMPSCSAWQNFGIIHNPFWHVIPSTFCYFCLKTLFFNLILFS